MLTVNLLGKFHMTTDTAGLGSAELRSDMLLKLAVYMIQHRDRVVPVQELTEALWDEDETDNPAGALKNLMYRLRTVWKKKLGADDFISTARGGYFWNQEIAVTVDAEEFERNVELAKENITQSEDAIRYCEEALSLYKGDFVQQVTDRYWGVTTSVYYHSMFLETIRLLAGLYQDQALWERMRYVCELGLRYDAVDEDLYCLLIRALMNGGNRKAALERCEEARRTLRENLGVTRAEHLDKVYEELLAMSGEEVAKDIASVSRDMTEEQTDGVFLCGYQIFREVYRLEARKVGRLGEAVYVVLLTLEVKAQANAQTEKFLIGKAMDQLLESLQKTLRIGDVAAQYSDRQYIIMLPSCTYESSQAVVARVLERFREKSGKTQRVTVKAEYEEVAEAHSALVK